MEYVTKYPKTISVGNGEDKEIHVDKMTGVEAVSYTHLTLPTILLV